MPIRAKNARRCQLFITGLILAVLGHSAMSSDPAPRFLNIGGVNLELSAVGVVTGGVLVADDELVGSVLYLQRDASGAFGDAPRASLMKIDRARRHSQPNSNLPRLFAVQDFEGIATNHDESRVYLVGSHAPTDEEKHRRTDREFLIKARWNLEDRELRVTRGKKQGVPGIYRGLIDHLGEQVDAAAPAGFNVEGLAWRDGTLHIGLRAPLSDGVLGRALVFSASEKKLFGKGSADFRGPFERLELDLEGGGIRGMHWDSVTGKLLVLSGPSAAKGETVRALWSYDFSTGQLTREHAFSAAVVGEHGTPEGVARFDDQHLLIVFDPDKGARSSMMLMQWE